MEGLAATMPCGWRPEGGRSRSVSWPEGDRERRELRFVREALDLMGVMRGALRRERRLKDRYRAHLRSLYEVWDSRDRDVEEEAAHRLPPPQTPISVLSDEVAQEGSIHLNPSTPVVPAKGRYQAPAPSGL